MLTGSGLAVFVVAGMAVIAPAATAVPAALAVPVAKVLHRVDTSPSTSVVARAPRSVSVTFDARPDRDSVELKIFGPDGEVSAAQPQVSGTAIRRPLDQSVPGGRYVVRWKARYDGGDALSGSFSFIAARGTGTFAEAPSRPTLEPTPFEVDATPTTPAVTTTTPPVAPTVEPAVTPTVTESVPVPGSASNPPGTGSDAGDDGSLSAGLKLVPVALGGLLVLASAVVGFAGSARRHERQARRQVLFVNRGLSLPWQRHQS